MTIPKQMLTALRKDDRFAKLSSDDVEKAVAQIPLKSLLQISGIAEDLLTKYALECGRLADLYQARWVLDDDLFLQAATEYYSQALGEDFSSETVNDLANLRQLAFYIATRELLTRKMSDVGDDDDGQRISRFGRLLDNIQSQIIALEKHLELDPAARAAKASQDQGASVISELVEAGAEYLREEGIIWNTEHGPVGYGMWFFPHRDYEPRCADCGSHRLQFISPWDDKPYAFKLYTPEQASRYVFAADFVPEGAPRIPIFEVFEKNDD